MNPEFLKGIMPALLTGFTDDLTAIDVARTRKLVRYLVDSGVHGLYVGGSSGEMLLCSVEERKTLLEAVLAETQKKVTVIAHIGATGTRETCELAAHAERQVQMRCRPSRRSILYTPLPMSSSIISTLQRHQVCPSSFTTFPQERA